jgi:2'-5' RNA ligase
VHRDPPTELVVNRWWRVDWWQDLRYVAWHLTFEASPSLHALVARYQDVLARLGGFDLIPREWLHLTLHGVGVAAELPPGVLAGVEASVRRRLAELAGASVSFHGVVAHPEAVGLCPSPASVVHELRAAVRAGVASAYAAELEDVDGYVPHVSIGYVNAPQPVAPVLDALRAVPVEPAYVEVREVSLLEMYLDEGVHRWRVLARVRLR